MFPNGSCAKSLGPLLGGTIGRCQNYNELGEVFWLLGGGIPLREYVGPSSLLSILLQSNEGSSVSQWQTAIIIGCSC